MYHPIPDTCIMQL